MTSLFQYTDRYFLDTATLVRKKGDCRVTYAFFLRHEALYAPEGVLELLETHVRSADIAFTLESSFDIGDVVPAYTPLFTLTGDFASLAPFETLLLQKIGLPCLVAWHAYHMALSLPHVDFIAMGARHCADPLMDSLSSYGVSVGSTRAKEHGAKGFLGTSTDATASYFGQSIGLGTMPHALIGYAGSTLKAALYYHETFPDRPMTVLVDYFGREVQDSLEVCRHFSALAHAGQLHIRLDTHGRRFCEGLDASSSHALLTGILGAGFEKKYTAHEQSLLMGMGVSAASVFHLRRCLDDAGFSAVGIVVSSGFNLEKCRLFGLVGAPVFRVGSGSYFPALFADTHATADIIAYDGTLRVKAGREDLFSALVSD